MREISVYDQGTQLEVQRPWGLFVGGKALCPDGRVRTLKRIAQTADTYFSVPAAVEYRGKTVSGYVTVSEDENERYVEFVPYQNGKNGNLFNEV